MQTLQQIIGWYKSPINDLECGKSEEQRAAEALYCNVEDLIYIRINEARCNPRYVSSKTGMCWVSRYHCLHNVVVIKST